MIGATLRRILWRLVIAGVGGLQVDGRLPGQPCVLVANHASHADTAALIAALPAQRRPVIAAAADYWFGGPVRSAMCRTLAGAFPVRRDGGGSQDLVSAAAMLGAGRDVIVYPEGTRTRDGSIGRFRTGAERLARQAGVPLVPVGIVGTRNLLPVHGRLRRGRIAVRVGAPAPDIAAARAAVAELAAAPASDRDHRLWARP
jgi:1-acyl-sn-glycerol-3-phosphate acyltransferase